MILLGTAPDWWTHEIGLDADVSDYRDECRVSVATVAGENASLPRTSADRTATRCSRKSSGTAIMNSTKT